MNPKHSLLEVLADLGLDLPEQTARDYLHRGGLKGCRPARKPLMSLVNQLKRQQWVRQWVAYDFNEVLFTDEKKWVCVNKGPQWVWRPVGARNQPKYCVPTKQASGGGSVMVWGAISRKRTYPLIRIESTLNGQGHADLLNNFFKQWSVTPDGRPKGSRASRPRSPWVFQWDNAAIHRSNVAEAMLSKWKVQVLPWPTQSPDLSPVENLWSLVSRKLRGQVFSNTDLLWAAVQREWNAVTPETLGKLCDSMPSRLQAVCKSHGYPTRY